MDSLQPKITKMINVYTKEIGYVDNNCACAVYFKGAWTVQKPLQVNEWTVPAIANTACGTSLH